MDREQQLRREIDLITAVTADFEAAARDLLIGSDLSPSNARAREEVIALLGVNYVGPESLGLLLYGDENKFPSVKLDYVKLKEILNEPDEWEIGRNRFETYALVFKPPISFLELKDRANEAANAKDKTPAFDAQDSYDIETFAQEAPASGSWELIRRDTVPGSTEKVLDDQKALIADKPNLATASFLALASLIVGQYLAHDIKLYEGRAHYGRTATFAASGGGLARSVRVGGMNVRGADVYALHYGYETVGLAVSRNLEQGAGPQTLEISSTIKI